MIDHVYISVSDPQRSFDLYLAALKPLGWQEYGIFSSGGPGTEVDTFGLSDGGDSIWLRKRPSAAIEGSYIGIAANGEAEVAATYDAALQAGALDDGAPGPRPQFAPGYYAANFIDYDGNQVEIRNKG